MNEPFFDDTAAQWTDADIQHAYSAGIEAGHAAGMCARLRDEFDAIADAVALIDWVEQRIRATSKHGEQWADYAVGPRPKMGGDRS